MALPRAGRGPRWGETNKVSVPQAPHAAHMSGMEGANVVSGPRGGGLWAGLEELESNEPPLEGCASNARRAGVMGRARAALAPPRVGPDLI